MKNNNNNNNVIITGGTGFIGTHLTRKLRMEGYQIFILTRTPRLRSEEGVHEVYWNPIKGEIDGQNLPEPAYIFNLAGAPIVGNKWSSDYKKLIIQSRVQSALLLKQFIEKKQYTPSFYMGASAIGVYGNSGPLPVDESYVGHSNRFIVHSVQEWEKAHQAIAKLGIRTVMLRIGLVLSKEGGMLEKMLLPARFGIYGYFGNGKQMQSWIHINDLVQTMLYGMKDASFSGIFNGVAPNPVTAKELSKTMKNSKGKGILMPIPKFILKIGMGERHRILLDSCNAQANKFKDAGFNYKYPDIKKAMKAIFEE
jgi:uncharacterized protein (TIGR01777 family)